jgi:hypothetical protein
MTFLKLNVKAKTWLTIVLPGLAFILPLATASAQPLSDSLKALRMRNEKVYRLLSSMDEKGASYEFTNVTAWHITDDQLKDEIIKLYQARYGEKQLKSFDISDVYLFVAPSGEDVNGNQRFEPFHILFMGTHVSTDTNNAGDIFFGGGRRGNSNQKVPVAFKGPQVIPVMMRQPGLVDDINAVQGEIVELPGDILPRGVQLIKSSSTRYIFHQMFEGFYSKRQIIEEQNRRGGLPTDDEFVVDSTEPVLAIEPDATPSLPEEVLTRLAFSYQKTIDISLNHLLVNVSRNNAVEIQLGNPEVGLPFWSSGEGRLWLNMKNQIGTESNFKIGVAFPANLGRTDALTFNARKLSGMWGGAVDAYFAGIDFFSAFNMPLAFNFTVLPSQGYNSSIIYNAPNLASDFSTTAGGMAVPSNHTFFRTTMIGQLYVPFIVQLDPYNFMQFSTGIGIHTVRLSWIPSDSAEATAAGYSADVVGKSQDLKWFGRDNVSVPVTPHVAIEYVNHRSNKFGLNFQYDHLFTFGTWLELIPDHLRIEGSYTAPLVRDAKPYEPNYFFAFTPRLYF